MILTWKLVAFLLGLLSIKGPRGWPRTGPRVAIYKDSNPGYRDELNKNILQRIIHIIAKPLTYIINLCLTNGDFPKDLKLAIVKPLFKALLIKKTFY